MRRANILRFPREQAGAPLTPWWKRLPAIAALIFIALLLTHAPLLSLAYFWDEAGYYIPAAHDLFANHQLVPTSTLSNAHPPLVMLWLAFWWETLGYHAVVTRLAMVGVSTFTLVGVFRLARDVSNAIIGVAAVICTALFPVFFAQSSLAHLDMAAAGFTLWAIWSYVHDRYVAAGVWFSLAALSKETAILAPFVLAAWELLGLVLTEPWFQYRASWRRTPWLLMPSVPLAAWFVYHFRVTGHLLGNPEFLRYNLSATLHPIRVVAALAQRLWQTFGYMNLFVLTIASLLALTREPRSIGDVPQNGHGGPATQRPRIAIPVQMTFAVVVVVYVLALSIVGGAVLARYLLPIYPLVIIVLVSTIWRRLPMWSVFIAVVCFAFVLALVVNPPYHFAPEDNLDYADFVDLHRRAAKYLQEHEPQGRVLTAWPASDELSKPYLGYVSQPIEIIRIDDFSPEQLLAAQEQAELYGTALLFSTKYEPQGGGLIQLPFWKQLQQKYFDYHVDVPPDTAAQILGGDITWEQRRGGQWAAIVQMRRSVNADLRKPASTAH
jgi:4-amino-4-deoxy-L-arabinose transferase-like glycosyltransferase